MSLGYRTSIAATSAAIGMVLAVTAGAFSADVVTVPAGPLPICTGGKRVTCIVDGDTGWLDGEKWRLAAIDTPEITKPECGAELDQGKRATERLRDLMASGYRVERDGQDRYGRTLVAITLADGRDAGEILIAEGLAQPWPNRGNVWCDGARP